MARLLLALLLYRDASAPLNEFDPRSIGLLPSIDVGEKVLQGAAFSPSGRLLGVGCSDGSLRLYETSTWRQVHRLEGHGGGGRSVVFSPDSRIVAVGCGDGTIMLWDVTSGQEERRLLGPVQGVGDLAFSPDGKHLLVAGASGECSVWSLETDRQVKLLPDTAGQGFRPAWSSNGRRVATAVKSGGIRIWKTDTWEVETTLPARGKAFMPLAFTRDGRWLAAPGPNFTVEIWNVQKGDVERTLPHGGNVYRLGFTRSERYLVSAGEGAVRIWDLATGQALAQFADHPGPVVGLAIDPCGRMFATIGAEGRLLLWGPKPGFRPAALATAVGPPGTAFLGVMGGGVPGDGVTLSAVIAGTAAERHGLKEGDVIVEFNGAAIGSYADLVREVKKCGEGEQVRLKLKRSGEAKEFLIKLSKLP